MLTTRGKNKKEAEALGGAERRRGKRLFLRFQIQVSGADRTGRTFRDSAVTSDVNEHGCRFDLLRELANGAVLKIQVLRGTGGAPGENKPLTCRVMWTEASVVGWTIGVEQLEPGDFWDITFPSAVPRAKISR